MSRTCGTRLGALAPRVVMYLMSFMTLGIFWTGQQTQFNALSGANRDLSWIHIVFLAAVSITPFSTSLLAEFITLRTALLIYWANILILGIVLYVSWRYAQRAGLVERRIRPGAGLRGGAPHSDRPIALRVRRVVVRREYLLEYRIHRAGAVDLCHRTEDPAAVEDVNYSPAATAFSI